MKVNTFIILFFLLTISLNNVEAQNISVSSKKRELNLKYPLSSLLGDVFSNTMGVSLGIEAVGERGWSFTQESGYIFKSGRDGLIFGSNFDHINGIRLTSELRKYQYPKKYNQCRGLFASIELDNFLLLAEEFTNEEKNEYFGYRGSITFNIGKKYLIGNKETERLTIDCLIGAGLGYFASDEARLNDSYFPSMNLDLKLGYRVSK